MMKSNLINSDANIFRLAVYTGPKTYVKINLCDIFYRRRVKKENHFIVGSYIGIFLRKRYIIVKRFYPP